MNYVAISQNDVLKMGKERNSNNNVNSQNYNWHHEWFKALNALDYYSYRYKYFYLENPPHNQGEDKSGDTYDYVQERILLNIKQLIYQYDSVQYINRTSEKIKDQLIALKEDSIKKEADLYEELYWRGEIGTEEHSAYRELVENTKPGDIVRGKNTIELWTYKVFPKEYKQNGGTFYNAEGDYSLPNDIAFSLIVGSKEFYEKFKILEKRKIEALFKKIAENTIPAEQITQMYLALGKAICKQTEGIVRDTFLKKLKDIFEKSPFESYSSAPMTFKMDNFSLDLNWNPKEDFYKEWKEMSSQGIDKEAFKKLLPKFQQVLKEFNAYLVNHKIHDQGFTANNFTYTTTINLGNDFVLTDNSNMLYLRQLKLEPEDDDDFTVNIKHRILSEVIEVMIDAMDMMYQDESLSLDELSLGVITFDNINYKQHTITSAINYCSKVFPNLISQKLQRNPQLWKTFKAQDSNKWVSGLFGEITALANFAKMTSMKYNNKTGPLYHIKLTGSTQATINGKKIGGSVNDIVLAKRESIKVGSRNKYKFVRHGVNVKHYVKQTGGMFKLYESSGSNGVFSSRTAKYLNAYQLNIVRFVLANSNFFEYENAGKKAIIQDIIFNIALESIPEYLRISDRTRQSANNLFFQINNVIYPTSYIYDCALAQLDWLVSRANNKEAFMNIIIEEEGLDTGKSYKNLANARRYWKDSNYRLSTSKKPEGKNAKIKTRGIKVNLVQL